MIKELTFLRGVFILFVFLHHMSVFPGGGGLGVAFFFVLGGFAMTLGYSSRVVKESFSYREYLSRRIVKFYPLHWLCLLAALPLVNGSFNWLTFGVNAALLHSWVPKGSFYFSYNMVSWYLANTMFFAVVFPFVFRWFNKMTKPVRWIGGGIFLLVYLRLVMAIPANCRQYFLYIFPLVRLYDFMIGVLSGLLFLRIRDKTKVKQWITHHSVLVVSIIIISILLLVSEALLLSSKNVSVAAYYWPLIVTILMASSLLGHTGVSSILNNKWLIKLGEYSFPFYMLHQVAIKYVYSYIRPTLCIITDNRYCLQVLLLLVCFFVTIILSFLIQNYYNKPITQWLTKRIQPSMTARS